MGRRAGQCGQGVQLWWGTRELVSECWTGNAASRGNRQARKFLVNVSTVWEGQGASNKTGPSHLLPPGASWHSFVIHYLSYLRSQSCITLHSRLRSGPHHVESNKVRRCAVYKNPLRNIFLMPYVGPGIMSVVFCLRENLKCHKCQDLP